MNGCRKSDIFVVPEKFSNKSDPFSSSARNLFKSTETRYYICSLPADAKILKDAARKHWEIENSCHWVLDVTYQEDNSRVCKGGAENLSRLKRLSLNILKQDKTKKGSIASKRFEAALDEDYRENLLRKAS